MKSRTLYILATLLFAGARMGAAERTAPNILFAIADDWGAHASAYGTAWVKTPAFDRIAREGLLFKHAYTPNAKCAPSRAILLTGRQSWQLEEAGNHLCYFPIKFKTWPEALSEKGWFVGLTGKGWGPGVAKHADGKPRALIGRVFNRHTAPPPAKGISASDYAASFADFLDGAPKGAPWCFWYGATEPHRQYEFQAGVNKGGKKLSDIDRVPAYWPDTGTVRHDILDYAYEIEHADKHLGRMIEELERRGLLENTVIIVTSDHGMPFPRVKGHTYVAAHHVPLAIRWPGGIIRPGRVIHDFVDFTDIAPTILEIAGVAPQSTGMAAMAGRSWREIFASKKSGQVVRARDHVLIGKERNDAGRPNDWGYPVRGIIREDFLYLRNYEPTRWPSGNPETGYLDTDGSPTKSLILELGRKDRSNKFWALSFGMRPSEELYELSGDPDCVNNLVDSPKHQKRRAALAQEMTEKLKAQGDPRMFGRGHVFDQYPIAQPDSRGFYTRFMRGENPRAGWVRETDFEKEPIK